MRIILFVYVAISIFFPSQSCADLKVYKLHPGDKISINVWGHENLSAELTIPPDGMISMPLIGSVDTNGFTIDELRSILIKKDSEYIPNVDVSVFLVQAKSMMAYVIGQVNSPGQYPINMNTSVMQILSMAGGLNTFASHTQIFILRRENDQIATIPFNYKQVERGVNVEQDVILQRGDVVVIP